MEKKKFTIDAEGRPLGRIASEVASILIGKNSPNFVKNLAPDVSVEIINSSKMKISEKKKDETVYREFTGFRGGLFDVKMSEIIKKKGYGELLKIAIDGMLPKNKLRKQMIKNLIVKE